MLGVGCGPQVGPFPSRPIMGSIRGEGTPPQTLAVIWRKKGVISLSSGCSRKAGEGVQPSSPPPPPPPDRRVSIFSGSSSSRRSPSSLKLLQSPPPHFRPSSLQRPPPALPFPISTAVPSSLKPLVQPPPCSPPSPSPAWSLLFPDFPPATIPRQNIFPAFPQLSSAPLHNVPRHLPSTGQYSPLHPHDRPHSPPRSALISVLNPHHEFPSPPALPPNFRVHLPVLNPTNTSRAPPLSPINFLSLQLPTNCPILSPEVHVVACIHSRKNREIRSATSTWISTHNFPPVARQKSALLPVQFPAIPVPSLFLDLTITPLGTLSQIPPSSEPANSAWGFSLSLQFRRLSSLAFPSPPPHPTSSPRFPRKLALPESYLPWNWARSLPRGIRPTARPCRYHPSATSSLISGILPRFPPRLAYPPHRPTILLIPFTGFPSQVLSSPPVALRIHPRSSKFLSSLISQIYLAAYRPTPTVGPVTQTFTPLVRAQSALHAVAVSDAQLGARNSCRRSSPTWRSAHVDHHPRVDPLLFPATQLIPLSLLWPVMSRAAPHRLFKRLLAVWFEPRPTSNPAVPATGSADPASSSAVPALFQPRSWSARVVPADGRRPLPCHVPGSLPNRHLVASTPVFRLGRAHALPGHARFLSDVVSLPPADTAEPTLHYATTHRASRPTG